MQDHSNFSIHSGANSQWATVRVLACKLACPDLQFFHLKLVIVGWVVAGMWLCFALLYLLPL